MSGYVDENGERDVILPPNDPEYFVEYLHENVLSLRADYSGQYVRETNSLTLFGDASDRAAVYNLLVSAELIAKGVTEADFPALGVAPEECVEVLIPECFGVSRTYSGALYKVLEVLNAMGAARAAQIDEHHVFAGAKNRTEKLYGDWRKRHLVPGTDMKRHAVLVVAAGLDEEAVERWAAGYPANSDRQVYCRALSDAVGSVFTVAADRTNPDHEAAKRLIEHHEAEKLLHDDSRRALLSRVRSRGLSR